MKIKKIFISFIMIFLLVFAFFIKTDFNIKAEIINPLSPSDVGEWIVVADENRIYYKPDATISQIEYLASNQYTFTAVETPGEITGFSEGAYNVIWNCYDVDEIVKWKLVVEVNGVIAITETDWSDAAYELMIEPSNYLGGVKFDISNDGFANSFVVNYASASAMVYLELIDQGEPDVFVNPLLTITNDIGEWVVSEDKNRIYFKPDATLCQISYPVAGEYKFEALEVVGTIDISSLSNIFAYNVEEIFKWELIIKKNNVVVYTFSDWSDAAEDLTITPSSANNEVSFEFYNDNDPYTVSTEHGDEILVYLEAVDTLSPVINGQTNYITNVDNPINEATIKSGLSAVDNVDGNIPSSAFVLVSDGYTENKNTIGEYDIVYKVFDSSGNEATVTVHVHVVDITKPTISGTNAYTVVYNQTLNLDGVKNGLIVNDNYDTGLIPTLVSDGYTSNKTVKGVYEVKYKATDTSNNVSDVFVVEVTVIDNIKPVISGNNTYTTPYNVQLTIDALKSVLSATDGYDGNITSQIALKTDNYTANKNVKGSYQVIFTVADSSNNSMDYTVTVTVTDDVPPVIYTTDVFINIDGALNYTLEQIIEHLINIGQLEAGINLENYIIAENNYDPDTPGEYEVVLNRQEYASSALPETLSINITVLEPETVEEPSENPTDDDPISDITPEPNYLDEIKDFFIKNFGTIVIGIVLLIVGLLVIKFVNPSNRRRR